MAHLLRRHFLAAGLAALPLLAALPAQAGGPRAIVYFTNWSAALDDTARSVIAAAAANITAAKAARVDVVGYADSDGSPKANMFLTEARAQQVIDALAAAGVDPHRLHLVARGRQDEAGIGSRRVEIVIKSH